MRHPPRRPLGRAALAAAVGLSVHAGNALPTPLRAQEAASAVQDVDLTDVTLAFGATVVSAPRVRVSGTRLSKDELLAIFKADAAEPWAARLQRLDAGSLTMPELRVERAVGGRRQAVLYRDVAARGVHAGRVAELTAAGASVAAGSAPGGPAPAGTGAGTGTGTYGRIRAEEIDLAALARIYGEPGDGRGAMLRLYGAVSVEDVVFVDDRGTRVALARLAGRDLAGRQTPGTWSAAAQALGALDAVRADPAARARAAGAAADLIEAVSVGALEASGLTLREAGAVDGDGIAAGPGRTPTGREPIAFGIGRLAYAADGPEAGVTLADLTFAGKGSRARLGRLVLAGASLAPTVAALRRIAQGAAGAGGTRADGNGAPNAEPPEAELRRLTPNLGTLTLTDLGLDLPGDEAPASSSTPSPAPSPAARKPGAPGDPLSAAPDSRTADPKGAGGKGAGNRGAEARGSEARTPDGAPPQPGLHVGLRGATLSFGAPQDGVPTASRLGLQGLTLPAATVAGVPGLGSLGLYGYRDLDLDLVADTAWDGTARELTLREISVAGREMGRLRINATLGGVGPEVFDPDAAVSGFAMLSTTAKALDLTVENGGLFERFIAAQSRALSLKPDELRKEYVTASVIGVPAILGNSPAARALGAAMGKFVSKPGTLSISARAKSSEGLGVVDVSTAPTPGAVLDKLEVSAKAE